MSSSLASLSRVTSGPDARLFSVIYNRDKSLSLGHVMTCLSLASLFLAVMLKQKHTVSQSHDSLAVLLWESLALREGFSDGEMSSRVPMTPD